MKCKGEKVALVTGASKGIGQAICVELAKSGYRIVVNYSRMKWVPPYPGNGQESRLRRPNHAI